MNKDKVQKTLIIFFVVSVLLILLQRFTLTNIEIAEARNKRLGMNSDIGMSEMTYTRFLEYLDLGWVKQVDLYDNSHSAIVQVTSSEFGNKNRSIRVDIPIGASQLIQTLKKDKINFDAHSIIEKSTSEEILYEFIAPVTLIVSLVIFFYLREKRNIDNMRPRTRNPMNLGNSPARFDPHPQTGVTFDDIAGIDEAKAEFEELVSFLNEPERYTRVGARIPKGALLVGPPGTGKTLLAKAIATEAKVPFFSVAGSEFVEMFVGVGAARIRNLFDQASEEAPCIIFIDEIDALGGKRGSALGGGSEEREQTLNQLLTEMDGFIENPGVIVVGATNRMEVLDPALIRPGRFDRQIRIGLPDLSGRFDILKVHAKGKTFAKNISLYGLANRTPGFSGADLANILNESAILATRYDKKIITIFEIEEAIDRSMFGIAGPPLEDNIEKTLIAYHEIGHALAGSVLANHPDVQKITLIPRGGAKGLTVFKPREDPELITRIELFATIVMMLSGRMTEQIVFGDAQVTTGASNDIKQATTIARKIVTQYGMSSLGPIAFEDGKTLIKHEDKLANRIDREVKAILTHCQKASKKIILENRLTMDYAVEEVLETDNLDGRILRLILGMYSVLPDKDII